MNTFDILPHRYPFIFTDRILEMEKGKRVVCLRNITVNEEFHESRFRENPAVPFTLIIEAMAQTSGLLLSEDMNGPQKIAFLAAIRDAKFIMPVTAGEQLIITSILSKGLSPLYIFNASANVDGKIVAEAEIILSDTGAE